MQRLQEEKITGVIRICSAIFMFIANSYAKRETMLRIH